MNRIQDPKRFLGLMQLVLILLIAVVGPTGQMKLVPADALLDDEGCGHEDMDEDAYESTETTTAAAAGIPMWSFLTLMVVTANVVSNLVQSAQSASAANNGNNNNNQQSNHLNFNQNSNSNTNMNMNMLAMGKRK